MNRVFRRGLVVALLVAILLTGYGFFAVDEFFHGQTWALEPYNAHLYRHGVLSPVVVKDRNGQILFDNSGAENVYADRGLIRAGMLHALGDPDGNIGTGILTCSQKDLVGYDWLTGVSRFSRSGATVRLNLDASLCAAAAGALGSYKGTVGVYRVKTGELLCMVSSPNFDPLDPPVIEDDDPDWEGVYLNRFLSAAYPPGSIFKIVTLQAALESVEGIEEKTFFCEGRCEIGGEVITCSGYHGTQTLSEAFAHSCNCAFAEIALAVGREKLQKTAERAGLTTAALLDGSKTAAGTVDVLQASDADLAWAAIGQANDLVNPCAFLRYVGAIANEGVAVDPAMIAYSSNKTLAKSAKERLMSAETAGKIAAMMRSNVENAYGDWHFPGWEIGAKSGTAQLDDQRSHSVFCGFTQNESDPVAFLVVVENAGAGQGMALSVASAVLNAMR